MRNFRIGMVVILFAGISAAGLTAVPAAAAGPHSQQSTPAAVGPLSSTLCLFGDMWPVTGDWDGVGGDGVGVVIDDGVTLTWYLKNGPSNGLPNYIFTYGQSGDRPVVGDWDGVGGDGPGYVRPSGSEWQWHLKEGPSAGADKYVFNYGSFTDVPVTGDWDGVGGSGPGVFNRNDASWYLRQGPSSGSPNYNFSYGRFADWPVVGDWDGVGGDGPGTVRLPGSFLEWHLKEGPSAGLDKYLFNYGLVVQDCMVTGDWDGIGGDGPGTVQWSPGGSLQWQLRNGPSAGPANRTFLFSGL